MGILQVTIDDRPLVAVSDLASTPAELDRWMWLIMMDHDLRMTFFLHATTMHCTALCNRASSWLVYYPSSLRIYAFEQVYSI